MPHPVLHRHTWPAALMVAILATFGAKSAQAAAWQKPTACQAETRFLGFGRNETIWVDEVRLRCQRDGGRDEYSVARVWATASGQMLATLQNRSPVHWDAHRVVRPVPAAQWRRRYPLLAHALPLSAWERFGKAAKPARWQYDFSSQTARVQEQTGRIAHAQVVGQRLVLRAAAAWQASVVVATTEGEDVAVAPLRGGPNEAVTVQLYYAPSGRHVALLVQQGGHASITTNRTPLPAPIDLPNLGLIPSLQWRNESLLRVLDDLHVKTHSDDADLNEAIDTALAI